MNAAKILARLLTTPGRVVTLPTAIADRLKRRRVFRHKKRLQEAKLKFTRYHNVAFIFQSFNKGHQLDAVLNPFLELLPANVILFADGCIDRTAEQAHRRLCGTNHAVILMNDTHEIRNYRLGVAIAKEWQCEYAVLLQDDDVYDANLAAWLGNALEWMKRDPLIAIIGCNGGFDLGSSPPKRGDMGLTTARFETRTVGGKTVYRLGDYEEMEISDAVPTPDGSSAKYVAALNKAPQIVRVAAATRLGFFPQEMEPWQYDDHYNCLLAWTSGLRILHMPISSKSSNIGTGGMRLYNLVSVTSRPAHFVDNWNYVLDHFKGQWLSGEITKNVREANTSLHRASCRL